MKMFPIHNVLSNNYLVPFTYIKIRELSKCHEMAKLSSIYDLYLKIYMQIV